MEQVVSVVFVDGNGGDGGEEAMDAHDEEAEIVGAWKAFQILDMEKKEDFDYSSL